MGSLLLRKVRHLRPFVRFSRSSAASAEVSTPKPSAPPPRFSSPYHPSVFSSSYFPHRSFSSSTSGPSNIVVIDSENHLNTSIAKAQDNALPSIFYFTAAWCGPCRILSPIVEECSKKYPHVTTYKIDIDLEDLGSALQKLNISSVPTLHFFHNGKKEADMVGADVAKLKHTLQQLYSKKV